MKQAATLVPSFPTSIQEAEQWPAGVLLLDRAGNILFANDRFATLLGYAPGEFPPKTVFQVNPHFNLMAWRSFWETLEQDGYTFQENELMNASGEPHALAWHSQLMNSEGAFLCCNVVEMPTEVTPMMTDVAHVINRFCLNHVSDIVLCLSPEGYVLSANDTALQKLKYDEPALTGLHLLRLEAELTMEKWQERWQNVLQQSPLEIQTALEPSSGEPISVRLSLYYLRTAEQEYAICLLRDLRLGGEWYEVFNMAFHTLEQSRDMIFWLKQDATFYYANNTFCQTTGYNREELGQMTLLDFFPKNTKVQFEEGWEQLRKSETHSEIEITCRDGSVLPVSCVVTMVNFNGREYSCTFLRNMSGRMDREAERQRMLDEIKLLNSKLEMENIILKEEAKLDHGFPNIISKSPNYRRVLRQIEQVAETEATVLILGETGTGKELLAKAIHQFSDRSDQPMVKINCGALPANLIESELFGHEKGAFTGAVQRKTGRFELAHKGTLFLDEIGELPLELQVKLLRVLQEGEFERLGGTQTLKVDVRLIAATNRNLEEEVRKGNFREDLFYRLNVFPIVNIPLRERAEDIPLLVRHFIEKYNQKTGRQVEEVPQRVMDDLLRYDFPGNVRELENLVERAVILSKGKTFSLDFAFKKSASRKESSVFKTMEQMEYEYILEALRRTNGKVSGKGGAAELLDMNDKTLTSRMAKMNIGRHDYLNQK